MKNTKKLFGWMLAMALTFGFILLGCEGPAGPAGQDGNDLTGGGGGGGGSTGGVGASEAELAEFGYTFAAVHTAYARAGEIGQTAKIAAASGNLILNYDGESLALVVSGIAATDATSFGNAITALPSGSKIKTDITAAASGTNLVFTIAGAASYKALSVELGLTSATNTTVASANDIWNFTILGPGNVALGTGTTTKHSQISFPFTGGVTSYIPAGTDGAGGSANFELGDIVETFNATPAVGNPVVSYASDVITVTGANLPTLASVRPKIEATTKFAYGYEVFPFLGSAYVAAGGPTGGSAATYKSTTVDLGESGTNASADHSSVAGYLSVQFGTGGTHYVYIATGNLNDNTGGSDSDNSDLIIDLINLGTTNSNVVASVAATKLNLTSNRFLTENIIVGGTAALTTALIGASPNDAIGAAPSGTGGTAVSATWNLYILGGSANSGAVEVTRTSKLSGSSLTAAVPVPALTPAEGASGSIEALLSGATAVAGTTLAIGGATNDAIVTATIASTAVPEVTVVP